MKNTGIKTTLRKALAMCLSVLMVISCLSAGMIVFAEIDGVPTRNDIDTWYGDATLYGAEKWDKTTDLSTLSFTWDAYSGSIGYNPKGGRLTFTYPGHIYLNVGETLEAAGYMGHMTAQYGDASGDVTDFRVMLSSAAWGESTRPGFSPIGTLISNYSHQGTVTEGTKIMTGSQSHYDFSNDGRGSDQIIGNKTSDNENFIADNESVVVWRNNDTTGNGLYDEYVLLTGTAATAGEVTFDPASNFTIGAAQRYTAFAWHTDNGARLNRSLFGNSNRPEAAPAENALSITVTVYDKSDLDRLIQAADNGSLTVDAEALAAARQVLADREVTQAQIDAAAASIGDKMTLLVNQHASDYTSSAAQTGLSANANTFNAVAYHCADPATGDINGDAYRNLVYAPYNDTYWSAEAENNNTFYTVALPSSVVMVYDGVAGHEPMSPVVLQHRGDRSMDYMYSKNAVLYFDHDWIGYTDESYNDWQGYQLWPDVPQHWNEQNPTNGSQYLIDYAYRDRNSMYRHINGGKQNPGTSTRRSFCNAYVYHGAGNMTEYYEKYSDAQLSIGYSHTWYNWTGSADPITAEVWPSGSIYVLNYKPIYEKLTDAEAVRQIIEGDTAWMYTEASVKRVKATIAAMLAANPNSFTYAGDVENGVKACAQAISDAKYMIDNGGLVLEKKRGTVTFVDQNGDTLTINGAPATYTKEYGESVAANEIPALTNTAYLRADNAQWDYGTELSWDPAIENNTVLVDAPEKICQISDSQTVQVYTVTFYDEDGATVLKTVDCQYGDYPVWGSETAPAAKQDYDNNYTFDHWVDASDTEYALNGVLKSFTVADPANSVRADLDTDLMKKYTAVYTSEARTDADYSAYDAALAEAEAVAALEGVSDETAAAISQIIESAAALAHDTTVTPARNYRSDDAEGVRNIADAVTALQQIVSTYTDGEGNLKDEYAATFTVIFEDENGDQIGEAQTVIYGHDATPPAEQTKESDAERHYTFNPWSGYENITADTTIRASFTPEAHASTAEPAWGEWSADNTVSASFKCDECDENITVNATVTSDEHEPTCTAAGYTDYIATVSNNGKTYTKTKRVDGAAATGHTYAPPADTDWTWTQTAGGYAATVTVNCVKGDDTQTPAAIVNKTGETAATHLKDGSVTYTATATVGEQTFTATKTDVVPKIAHTWDYANASYSWNDGLTACTATVRCSGCDKTTDIMTENISHSTTQDATCVAEGVETYTATFEINDLSATTTQPIAKDPSNHAGEIKTRRTNEVAGTCVAAATWTEESYCDACGAVTASENKTGSFDPENHATTETVTKNAKEPGYTFKGYTGDEYCKACDVKVADGRDIDKKNINDDPAVVSANAVIGEPSGYDPDAVSALADKVAEVIDAAGTDNNEETVLALIDQLAGMVGDMGGSVLYTLTVNADNGSAQTQITGTAGSDAELGTPAKEGFKFKQWTVTAGSVNGTIYTFAEENATATAVYVVDTDAAVAAAEAVINNPDDYDDDYVNRVAEKLAELDDIDADDPANNDEVESIINELNGITADADSNRAYTVTFIVDGETVKTKKVRAGESATAPDQAQLVNNGDNHKVFSGWTGEYTNVNADVTVTGSYTTEDHTWVDGTGITPATCSTEGSQDQTCACGAAKTKTLAKDPDNHVNTKEVAATDSTCTAHGYTAGVYCSDCGKYISGHSEKPLADHSYTVLQHDADGHWYKCANCESVTEKVSHTAGAPVESVIRNATCTAEGEKKITVKCSVCNEVVSETTEPIGMLAHNLTKVAEKAPTCSKAGNIEYYVCSVCGKRFADAAGTTELTAAETRIAATGEHVLVHVPAKAATATGDGNTEYWYCEQCGLYFADAAGTRRIDKNSVRITATNTGRGNCPYCGGDHNDHLYGWIIYLLHVIAYYFMRFVSMFK